MLTATQALDSAMAVRREALRKESEKVYSLIKEAAEAGKGEVKLDFDISLILANQLKEVGFEVNQMRRLCLHGTEISWYGKKSS